MTWGWSHSAEAYHDALLNFQELDDGVLRVIESEWRGFDKGGEDAKFEDFPHPDDCGDYDIESLWIRIQDQARCTNGGWDAHVCPWGCHTVPFSRKATEEV